MANGNGNGQRMWENFWRFLSVIAVPFCASVAWMMLDMKDSLNDLKIKVAVMENNRFTSEDGLAVWQELSRKANINDVPPQWFIERVTKLEREFESHKVRTRNEELGQ